MVGVGVEFVVVVGVEFVVGVEVGGKGVVVVVVVGKVDGEVGV